MSSHLDGSCITHDAVSIEIRALCTTRPITLRAMRTDGDTKAQGNRLRTARQAKGFSDATAGAAFLGVSRDTYIQHENGTRSFRRAVDHYASRFDVSPEWLLWGRREGARKTVPLVGYVGAGAEAHFYGTADEGLGEVNAPEGATAQTVAAEIRGVSLGPLFDRWLVYYDDVRSPVTSDLIGELCVVGLPDDRVLVKKLQRSRGSGLFHLLSNTEDPLLDQEVLWAAKVRTMTPR